MNIGIIIIIVLVIIAAYLNSPTYKGKDGERIVAKTLEKISTNTKVINNIILNDNGKSRQIDHIIISEYGVFVIETKNYGGVIYGKELSENWKQYLNNKSFEFKNPIHQNYGHYQIVKKLLEEETDEIEPIVVFIKRCKLKLETKSAVVYHDKLIELIKSRAKVLNEEKIEQIYKILMDNRVQNEETIKNHNYNVKKYVEYKESIASNGKCPRCNGDLILRKSKKGEFYGCSNYPKCRYIKKLDKIIK